MDSNKIVRDRLPHDECGADMARVLYEDGHWYCFKCDQYGREEGEFSMSQPTPAPIKGDNTDAPTAEAAACLALLSNILSSST